MFILSTFECETAFIHYSAECQVFKYIDLELSPFQIQTFFFPEVNFSGNSDWLVSDSPSLIACLI